MKSFTNETNLIIENLTFKNLDSDAIELNTCDDVVIRNCSFTDIKGEAIRMNESKNISIHDCKFDTIRTGIYAVKCSENIKIENCYCKNVQGPMPRGQFVQFNECVGNFIVQYNVIENELGKSMAEDAINLFKTHGKVDNHIQIRDNYIKGGGPSKSGGGIMTGNLGGSYIDVRNNILVDPGQYGIACTGAHNVIIDNNQIYGKQQKFTNVGLYVGLANEPVADNVSVSNNTVSFINKDGVSNPWWKFKDATNVKLENNRFKEVEYKVPAVPSEWGVKKSVEVKPWYALTMKSDLYQHMLDKGLWVFCHGIGSITNPATSVAVRDRIKNEDDSVMMRIKVGDRDVFNANLNPRTEIRPENYSMEWDNEYTILYDVMFSQSTDGTVMQIMGRPDEINGSAGPLLQIENRKEVWDFRGWGIGESSAGIKVYFGDKIQFNKLYRFKIHFRPHNQHGFIKVWLDDKVVLDHRGKTYTNSSKVAWTQFGVYGGGNDRTTENKINVYKFEMYKGLVNNDIEAPVEAPDVEEPPVEEPAPVEEPPVEEPPVEEPAPVEEPPVEEPPVEAPDVEEPPVEEPPVEEPDVEEPTVRTIELDTSKLSKIIIVFK